MKATKTFLIILIVTMGFVSPTLGQVLTENQKQSPQELYDFHISKKKTNTWAGWITLGGGIAMIVGGIGWNSSTGFDGDTTNNKDGLWLSYLGGATTLVSIPLFISAGKHKRKAKIQLKNGAVGFNNGMTYTGMGIALSF